MALPPEHFLSNVKSIIQSLHLKHSLFFFICFLFLSFQDKVHMLSRGYKNLPDLGLPAWLAQSHRLILHNSKLLTLLCTHLTVMLHSFHSIVSPSLFNIHLRSSPRPHLASSSQCGFVPFIWAAKNLCDFFYLYLFSLES